MNHLKRVQKVRQAMKDDSLDALLFTHLPNLYYLSGFRGSDGALLITQDHQILLVDGRYGTQAKSQAPQFETLVYPDKVSGIAGEIQREKLKSIGFESRATNVELHIGLTKALPEVALKPMGPWIHQLRKNKDADEMKILRKANAIADESAKKILEWIKPGITESDLATELEYRMKKKGAEKASFSILVAGGERGALPHAMPTDRKLKSDELFFLDFGCTYEGYQTDQTLTIALGRPKKEWKEIYQIVKEAHDRAIEVLQVGVAAKELDRVARDHIVKAGYGPQFSHSLGHGVGIEVHEYPPVSSKSDAVIEEGMVLTIEPGIYLPNQGGVRIEDTLFISKSGASRLTTVDKELLSL